MRPELLGIAVGLHRAERSKYMDQYWQLRDRAYSRNRLPADVNDLRRAIYFYEYHQKRIEELEEKR
jgi:hypothetical protein